MSIDKILESKMFDSEWYSRQYPDVSELKMIPFDHYIKYGGPMRRQPCAIFDPIKYAKKNKLSNAENPLIHFYENYGLLSTPETRLTVNDLKNKLWGGFSQQSIVLLEQILSDRKHPKSDRAAAAYTLGRWFSSNNEPEIALKHLKKIQPHNIELFRSKKTKLLIIDNLIKLHKFEEAKKIIDYVLEKEKDSDFLCALNNIYCEKDTDKTSIRIEILNSIYKNSNFLEISVKEKSRGLVFDNISFDFKDKIKVSGPKVSILMPVYGAGKFIDIAIESMLSQTWQNIEIIAVEDCSPDDSWEKLKALANMDSRLKIFRNDVNLGAYSTRNKCLELSTGDYITVHDSDDWSHPQMIERQMQALLENPQLKATCSFMTRATENLRFILRPQRDNLEHIHRSYPSLLIAREHLNALGRWDGVSANADDEFIQRLRTLWGKEALGDVSPDTPLSFFLVHENSLTQQKGTSLNSLTFGIRKEYARQANYWRNTRADKNQKNIEHKRTSFKSPFPIPQGLAPKNWKRNWNYDIVIISDLSLLGGTRRCNEGYIAAASNLGLRVGLFHWPRFDLKTAEIAAEYMELSYQENVDILVPEDSITSKLVLIHHPPILKHRIDSVPNIETDQVAILVNQSPMQRWSQMPFYYDGIEAAKLCREYFNNDPLWIGIAPRVKDILEKSIGFQNIHENIWYPPHHGKIKNAPALPEGFGSERPIRIGRHARDHWTKWPASAKAINGAYCVDANGIETHLLGGAHTAQKILGQSTSNWTIHEFDSIAVTDFISHLDFFLHFVHEDYIEEFGRNIMEAMAESRVAILPPDFTDIFGEAALYCQAEDVHKVVRQLWDEPDAYLKQAQKGLDFVKRHCDQASVSKRLQSLILQSKINYT